VKKIVKIGQYLAKIRKKYNSLLFLAHSVQQTEIKLDCCYDSVDYYASANISDTTVTLSLEL